MKYYIKLSLIPFLVLIASAVFSQGFGGNSNSCPDPTLIVLEGGNLQSSQDECCLDYEGFSIQLQVPQNGTTYILETIEYNTVGNNLSLTLPKCGLPCQMNPNYFFSGSFNSIPTSGSVTFTFTINGVVYTETYCVH